MLRHVIVLVLAAVSLSCVFRFLCIAVVDSFSCDGSSFLYFCFVCVVNSICFVLFIAIVIVVVVSFWFVVVVGYYCVILLAFFFR